MSLPASVLPDPAGGGRWPGVRWPFEASATSAAASSSIETGSGGGGGGGGAGGGALSVGGGAGERAARKRVAPGHTNQAVALSALTINTKSTQMMPPPRCV